MHSSYWQRLLGSDRDGDLEDIVRSGAPGFSWVPEPPNAILQQPNACLLPGYGLREHSPLPEPPGPDPAAGGSSLLASQKLLEEEMCKLSGCDVLSRVAAMGSAVVDLPRSGTGPVATDVAAIPGQISSLRCAPAAAIKRRKSQAKKVVCIPAPASTGSRQSGEVVPSDLWAWRKYGQKPIKGSPYPRGYYRCSSSKGCLARKQVERSRTDPNMLVITYTSEHNHPWPTHRNALAGSTRPHSMKITSNPCSSTSRAAASAAVLSDACNDACAGAPSGQLMKEEEMEMEIDGRMPPVEHMSSSHSDDPFAGLGELAPEPADMVFPREFLEGDDTARESKMLPDPFSLLDWGGSSFEPKSDWL